MSRSIAASGGTTTPPHPADGAAPPPRRVRTLDLVTAVMIGVVFGVVFLGFGVLYTVTDPITTIFPPSGGILGGLWLVPGLVAGLVTRKPGTALLAEVIAASVSAALGSQWGIGTLVSGILQGVGVEIVLALTRYRRFTIPVAMAGGALSAAFEWVFERFTYYPEWAWSWAFAHLGILVVSGALLGGLLAWAVVRALAATGALDPFAAGREHQRARSR